METPREDNTSAFQNLDDPNDKEAEDKETIERLSLLNAKTNDGSNNTVDESIGVSGTIENNSLTLTPISPCASNTCKRSESLALISSLYDYSSDSGSDNKSLTDGFSEHHSDCFSSNSEHLGSGDSEESDSDLESIIAKKPSHIPKQLRVKGELNIKDLPPIENLCISVKEEECTPFGKVYSIVDTLLVVQSLPDKPALNLDSVFFRHNGDPVGSIFDVFGPVKRPFYSVRFNSNQEIHNKGLKVDVVLYAAPDSKHTQYVFAQQLMKEKGSDASWVNDCEPPVECIDYSDDEEERNNKRKQKVAVKKEEIIDDSPARKKYLSYEERMNKNNVMRNKYYKTHNTSFKRTWDIGWHNRIDHPLPAKPYQPPPGWPRLPQIMPQPAFHPNCPNIQTPIHFPPPAFPPVPNFLQFPPFSHGGNSF